MARRAAATLPIHLDHRIFGRLHEQIYAAIRRAIVSGILRPRTRIASSRALAADLGVSRTTTQLALDQLHAEGYLVTHRGSGTFIADNLPDGAPRLPASRPPSRHPPMPLSRRGASIAAGRPPATRIGGPPRPFRIGVPALELFPVETWRRLANRRVTSITARDLDYGEAAGLRALREAIADHTQSSRGTRCEADQVFIVGGAQRGLDLVCRLLLDPGDGAVVEDPGYPGAWSALAGAGAKGIAMPVDDEGLIVAADALDPGRVRLAYVTPSHQFPLGVPMSLPRRLALLHWASMTGTWLVEDDYDCEFRYGAQPVPCLQGLDADGRVVYVGTFSKSVFPALRLGFLIVPPGLRDRLLAARKACADPQPPFLEQAIMADFIAEGHFARHLRRMRAIYAARLQALAESAERFCGDTLQLRPARTGLHAVADLNGVDAGRVYEEARQRGVELMPLSAYVFGRARVDNAVVLGFGSVAPDRVVRGMEDLAAAIEAAQRPGRQVATPIAREVAIFAQQS